MPPGFNKSGIIENFSKECVSWFANAETTLRQSFRQFCLYSTAWDSLFVIFIHLTDIMRVWLHVCRILPGSARHNDFPAAFRVYGSEALPALHVLVVLSCIRQGKSQRLNISFRNLVFNKFLKFFFSRQSNLIFWNKGLLSGVLIPWPTSFL